MEEITIGKHLNKPGYRYKRKIKQKTKTYYKSYSKHKEQQKDKHEDLKKKKKHFKIIECGEVRKSLTLFKIMCLSLYDSQAK